MSVDIEPFRLGVDLICGNHERAAACLGVGPKARSVTRVGDAARAWSSARSIRGVGVGSRVRGGFRRPGELVVKVFVDRKIEARRLVAPVPPTIVIPGYGELEIDVEPVGSPVAHMCSPIRRPAPAGSSIGHALGGAGTFGCLVRTRDDQLHLLSAAHVLSPTSAKIGDPIYQPAYSECRRARAPIATLSGRTALQPGSSYPNTLDAAIAKLIRPDTVTSKLLEFGVAPGKPAAVALHDRVETSHSSGQVTGVHMNVALRYSSMPGRPLLGFRDQITCTRISSPGDSGAIVLDERKRVIGMIIGGSDRMSVCTPIAAVFEEFGLGLP